MPYENGRGNEYWGRGRCKQKNMKMGEEEEVMMLGQLLGLCTSRKKNLITDNGTPGNHKLFNKSYYWGGLKWLI